jgi:hypothetical protein
VEGPADTDEASIPTEPESMNMSGTTLKRKACTKTCVTKLTAANIKSSPEEDIPAKKKPRLQVQVSLPAIAADADTLNVPPDAIVAAPVASSDAGGTDPVTASPMKPNGGAARAPHSWWTPEDDKKLASAVKTTCQKKYGEGYRLDWVAIAVLVPGQTKRQCVNRWETALFSKRGNDTTVPKGKWTKEEDSTLKDAVKKHKGEDWAAIAALVPGRTKKQCTNRWHNVLEPRKNETTTCKAKWTKEEDAKLTDAAKKHHGKNWEATAALVPGRSKHDCSRRWHDVLRDVLVSTSADGTALKGKWTKEEDAKLVDATKTHNGEDWAAISALVPGRTKQQCRHRWHDALVSTSDETTARLGKWTKEEDSTLRDAVEKHNGKDWAAISAFVPGRTKTQCWTRWRRCHCDVRLWATIEADRGAEYIKASSPKAG